LRPLATIEVDEQAIGRRDQVVVLGKVMRSQGHAAEEFSQKFGPIHVWERLEFVEQPPDPVNH
jgi:hypothetical protein